MKTENPNVFHTHNLRIALNVFFNHLFLVCDAGKLTVIVGKSGSGKTSLLAAILKEMRLVSGELIWNKYVIQIVQNVFNFL